MDQETRMMFEKLFDSIENMEISLKKEIGEIKGEINGMKGEINGMKGEINGMKGEINGMKGEIAGIKGEIAEIKGEIKEIKAEQTRMNERLDVLGQMYGMHDLAIKTLQAKKII
ncbi:MAG: hypothetical protein PWQ70_1985 [Clostridiales bacterium]|nr:hypothetical protein [Clostridiales bacterium]